MKSLEDGLDPNAKLVKKGIVIEKSGKRLSVFVDEGPVGLIIQDKEAETLLGLAIRNRNFAAVRKLVTAGAHINGLTYSEPYSVLLGTNELRAHGEPDDPPEIWNYGAGFPICAVQERYVTPRLLAKELGETEIESFLSRMKAKLAESRESDMKCAIFDRKEK